MASCSYCGRKVSSDADFCPGCGKKKPGEFNGCLGIIILVVIIIAVLGGGKNNSSSSSSSTSSSSSSSSLSSTSSVTSKPQNKWEIEK